MCFGIFKKTQLAPLYPNELPSMPVSKVIEELEYDIWIHESYAGLVVERPEEYSPAVYGDYDWHIRWIEIYHAAIYYLRVHSEQGGMV